MQDPEKGYQLHHITQEKTQNIVGIIIGDKRETSIKSQNPAHAALTCSVFALCKRMQSKTKQAIHKNTAKHPKHIMQCSAAFPASVQLGFFPLIPPITGGRGLVVKEEEEGGSMFTPRRFEFSS